MPPQALLSFPPATHSSLPTSPARLLPNYGGAPDQPWECPNIQPVDLHSSVMLDARALRVQSGASPSSQEEFLLGPSATQGSLALGNPDSLAQRRPLQPGMGGGGGSVACHGWEGRLLEDSPAGQPCCDGGQPAACPSSSGLCLLFSGSLEGSAPP